MKHLSIPHIPSLAQTDLCDVSALLDSHGAKASIDQVCWASLFPYRPLAMVTAAHDGEHLYLDFFTRCNYLLAEVHEPLGPVADDSCVEFFVQPRGQGHQYWNFEFNCIGTVNASRRQTRPAPTRLSLDEIDSIRRQPSCGTRPFCEIQGLFSWSLLVALPLALIGVEYRGKPVELRANFYKCASRTSAPHYLAWNAVDTPAPDFHRPEFFGSITLE